MFHKIIVNLLLLVLFLPITSFGAYYQVEKIVSVDSQGTQGGGISAFPDISADGKYIVFHSDATNLVVGDTNNQSDIFLHDSETQETVRISEAFGGGDSNGSAYDPVISADGRYVVFESNATNLVANDINGKPDVFLYDNDTQVMSLISRDSLGFQGNNDSTDPVISADGRYIVFKSSATNLVPGDTNGVNDAFVRDTLQNTTTRISVDSQGGQSNGASNFPQISQDGNFIVFISSATNLVSGDTNAFDDIFVYNMLNNETTRISVDSQGGQSNGASGVNSSSPRISTDGRYIVFTSNATNLVPDDTNGVNDVFVRDTQLQNTFRITISTDNNQVTGGNSSHPNVIDLGPIFVFASAGTNLVSGDTNGVYDIFIRDMQNEKTTRLIMSDPLSQANASLFYPVMSDDGEFIVFHSSATNLVSGDTNGVRDVFLARKLNPELSYSGSFSETSENDGSVEGSLVVMFTNSDDTFVNQGGVLDYGTDYEIENLPAGLSAVLSINNNGTQATLILEGYAIDHESIHSLQDMTIRFFDSAFTLVDADDVINVFYDQGLIAFSNRRRPPSSGGSVQSQVSNLESMGKDILAEKIKEDFSHLFNETPSGITLDSLIAQLVLLQNQLSLLQSSSDDQSTVCPKLYQYIQGFPDCIRSLQFSLGNVHIDGIFGSRTKQSVMNFQKSKNLVVDGIVGIRTKQLLGLQ